MALLFQRTDPGGQLVQNIPQPYEVILRGGKAALRLVFAVAVFRDAGRLFENFAPLVGFCADDLRNAALPDDRVSVAADAGIQKQLVAIF